MRIILLVVAFCATCFNAPAQSLYFPPLSGSAWDTIAPAQLGWCPNKIDTLLQFLEDENTKAFLVLKDGKIVI